MIFVFLEQGNHLLVMFYWKVMMKKASDFSQTIPAEKEMNW